MKKFHKLVCVLVFSLLVSDQVWAQAYCELRDPTRSIHDLFPKSSNYQSIVRTIDKASRTRINSLIPLKDGLHFNELGQHTLYAVYKDKLPIGYVHVRAERSQWGLIEVAWAVSLDLKIVDFRFQRCRNPKKRTLEKVKNRAFVQNKSLKQLRALLSEDGASIKNSKNIVPGAEQLSAAVIRCGIKTLVTTAVSWKKVLRSGSAAHRIFTQFPKKAQSFEAVTTVITEAAKKAFAKGAITEENSGVERKRMVAYKVKDKNGATIAVLLRAKVKLSVARTTVWFAVNKAGVIEHIECRNSKYKASFQKLIGKTKNELVASSEPTKRAALELFIVASSLR